MNHHQTDDSKEDAADKKEADDSGCWIHLVDSSFAVRFYTDSR